MTHHLPAQARSIYRSILRELPRHQRGAGTGASSSLLSRPSPLHVRIREYLAKDPAADEKVSTEQVERTQPVQRARLEEAQQLTEYVRAQGMYIELLERYNPGTEMDEQERVRLTARRVGMDVPLTEEERGMEGGDGNGSGVGAQGR